MIYLYIYQTKWNLPTRKSKTCPAFLVNLLCQYFLHIRDFRWDKLIEIQLESDDKSLKMNQNRIPDLYKYKALL